MSRQRLHSPQFDLFIPYVADVPLRDQRETMERPFFISRPVFWTLSMTMPRG